jgi:putative Holliday junction resolvase
VSPQAAKTQAFAAELGELTGLPIHLWDERLTTREAHQILYEAGHAGRSIAESWIRWPPR